MAQQAKIYLDNDGNPIKNEPVNNEEPLDTAPSLKTSNVNTQNNEFYDYDAARKAGITGPDASGHWPSEFKKPGHPNEFVGGYSTITGEPNPNQIQETDPNKLREMGWNSPPNKKKVYLDPNTGEPISNNVDIPEITSPRGFEGNALDASMTSAKGFLKGATLDLPESIMNAITSAPGLMKTSMGPLGDMIFGGDSASDIMSGIKSIPPAMREMWELAKTNPEEFGRMMGNITGQPLVTAGLAKGMPAATRMAGAPVETTGKVMRKYAPMSGTIPRMMEPRIARAIERGVGRGVESIGQRMRNVGRSTSNTLADDILGTADEVELTNSAGRPLNRPNISEQIIESELTKDSPFFTKNRPQTNVEGTFPFPNNPDIMQLNDGSYVNLKTGQIMAPIKE